MSHVRFVTAAWGPLAWLLEPFRQDNGLEWTTAEGVEHPSNFSRKLLNLLETMDEPVIFWSCVDHFFDRPLPVDTFESLAQYMVERGDVVRLGVAVEGYPWEPVDEWQGIPIGRCSDLDLCSVHAGLIMDCALFSRDLLLRVLELRWTIWEAERLGTEKVLADPALCSLSIRPGLFQYVGLSDHNTGFWHLSRLFSDRQRQLVLEAAPEGVTWQD